MENSVISIRLLAEMPCIRLTRESAVKLPSICGTFPSKSFMDNLDYDDA